MTLSDDTLKALEALCAAATPGPWKFESSNALHVYAPKVGDKEREGAVAEVLYPNRLKDAEAKANARFIAAANPAVVAELVAEVRRLRAAVDQVRSSSDNYAGDGSDYDAGYGHALRDIADSFHSQE